jgi:hypothetical protein
VDYDAIDGGPRDEVRSPEGQHHVNLEAELQEE